MLKKSFLVLLFLILGIINAYAERSPEFMEFAKGLNYNEPQSVLIEQINNKMSDFSDNKDDLASLYNIRGHVYLDNGDVDSFRADLKYAIKIAETTFFKNLFLSFYETDPIIHRYKNKVTAENYKVLLKNSNKDEDRAGILYVLLNDKTELGDYEKIREMFNIYKSMPGKKDTRMDTRFGIALLGRCPSALLDDPQMVTDTLDVINYYENENDVLKRNDPFRYKKELAFVYSNMRLHNEALKELEELEENYTLDLDGNFLYGKTLRALGRNDEAKIYYKKCIELGKDQPDNLFVKFSEAVLKKRR